MKEFLQILRRYAGPYKNYVIGSVILNILSAIFNIFSFTLIIPILRMIFNMDGTVYEFIPWGENGFKETLLNNLYYFMSVLVQNYGPSMTLLLLGLFLGVMTALKTSCYFGSSA
ncbi:MAG: ABC transporter ATP-binding protein, partial [Candidatus Cryptobacteroides sp.]